jgi:hypothetical protein
MNLYRLLFLVLALIGGSSQAYTPSIEIIEQFDNMKLVAFFSERDIENYPIWHPTEEAPPLSIKEAIQAVNNTNGSELSIDAIKEIELREISHYKHYWHYLIKTKTKAKTKYRIYVVLMNGKVIPAVVEPESYK